MTTRRAVPSRRSITSSRRDASWWMSSRSIGVMKLLSIRVLIDRVRTSAWCSMSLICRTSSVVLCGSAKSRLRSAAAVLRCTASWLNRSKNCSSRGRRRFSMSGGSRLRWVRSYPAVTLRANRVARPLQSRQVVPMVRVLDLPDRVAFGHEAAVLEQLDQHDASNEATHVRPHRHAAGYLGTHRRELRQAGDHLDGEPPEQHQPRRDREDLEEDDEDEEHVHPHPWVEHQIGAHHPGDRPGGTDGLHWGCWLHEHVCRGGDQAADQVEAEEAAGPHAVLDVVSEDPEEEHVAEQVSPAAVQEHREDRREPIDRLLIDSARHSAAQGHGEPDARLVGELAWHESEVANRGRERDLAAGTLDDHPDRHRDADEQPGHPRGVERRILVADR